MLIAVARFVCLRTQNDHQRQVKMQELDRAREALNLIAPAVTRSQCTAAIDGSWHGDPPKGLTRHQCPLWACRRPVRH